MTTVAQLEKSIEKLSEAAMKVKRQRDSALVLAVGIVKGFDADPGTSDLDDEQPINVRMTLGDYRSALALLWDAGIKVQK